MGGHPVASLRRFCGGGCGGAVVVFGLDACSSSAVQREDARMGSAAAMIPCADLGSLGGLFLYQSCWVLRIWLAVMCFLLFGSDIDFGLIFGI